MTKRWRRVFLLSAAPVLFGQQAELNRLIAESKRLRGLTAPAPSVAHERFGEFTRPDWTGFKNLLRDWIESRLPADIAGLDAAFPALEAQLTAELWRNGLFEPDRAVPAVGHVWLLKLSRPAEYPGGLMVQAGVSVPCGYDASVYLYYFTANARTRVLEASGDSKDGNYLLHAQLSTSNVSGSHMFYVSWLGVQCASSWNALDYRLFRIDPDPDRAAPLFSGTHSFVIDDDSHARLTPEELLLELTAEALEPGFRRTYVLHYSIGPQGVQRIDPVALQPQDFVHEWLIRTWSEMQSRSSAALAKWHKFLHADYVSGEYGFAQPGKERPGFTQVAVDVDQIGDRETPEPLAVYFLVEDKGEHRYQMSEISFERQSGCPGETYATYDNRPSLFKNK